MKYLKKIIIKKMSAAVVIDAVRVKQDNQKKTRGDF